MNDEPHPETNEPINHETIRKKVGKPAIHQTRNHPKPA